MKTKIINIFGGPGSGKSIFCMELLSTMKKLNTDKPFTVEYVSEAAKNYVWTNSKIMDGSEKNQTILLGEQLHRLENLNTNVDFIVTDSPIFLNALYNKECTWEYEEIISRIMSTYDNINYFLIRDLNVPYESAGRLQTLEEAIQIDENLERILDRHGIKYAKINYDPIATANEIIAQYKGETS